MFFFVNVFILFINKKHTKAKFKYANEVKIAMW